MESTWWKFFNFFNPIFITAKLRKVPNVLLHAQGSASAGWQWIGSYITQQKSVNFDHEFM
jgi:hypothetical protein